MSLFCCEALQIVTDRCAGTGRGIEVRTLFSVRNGEPTRTEAIVNFPKQKRAKGAPRDKFADATYAIVNHCPFCGESPLRKRGKATPVELPDRKEESGGR